MIRAAIGFVWSAWGGHAALVAGALMALQVHAAYRVPASAFVTLLPWLGVVITVTTLIGHLIPLLPFVVLSRTPALVAAIALSALSLFAVGVYSALTLVGNLWTNGLKMVTIGLGAAALGFVVGRLFNATGV